MKPSIGRIVHYNVPTSHGSSRWRPAVVVGVFGDRDSDPLVNLHVFLDGLNDLRYEEDVDAMFGDGIDVRREAATCHVGSAREGTAIGEWRWPPRVS